MTPQMRSPYPSLLAPLKLGPLHLANRVVMGAMHTGLESRPDGAERLAAFYGERARGGTPLIISGGHAPDAAGRALDRDVCFDGEREARAHRRITAAVHEQGGRILLQILHAGGYARHAGALAASAVASPFSPFVPRAMTEAEIEATIEAHARCAVLARDAGYDGVDLLGAGGYLLNGFFSPRTNRRDDRWGGSLDNRCRLAVRIVQGIRAATGCDFVIGYRLSLLDLVEGGSRIEDTVQLAQRLESAGADFLGTAFGWHESKVPTVAGCVPDAAFASLTRFLRDAVSLPLMLSNRIHDPQTADRLLGEGRADLVALARPLLADADFVVKAARGEPETITPCLCCNQACLDRTFGDAVIGCIVNPRACRESEAPPSAAGRRRRVTVVGAGPAGLACAATAAEQGHDVTLYEKKPQLGGQLQLAACVPGKAVYRRTVDHLALRLQRAGGRIRAGHAAPWTADSDVDVVVLATGAVPRDLSFKGRDHDKVMSYAQLLGGERDPGRSVVIVGSGPIAYDVAQWLLLPAESSLQAYLQEWGVDLSQPGGVGTPGVPAGTGRQVWMLQRGRGKPGRGLGVSTGWAHRLQLARRGLRVLSEASIVAVDAAGVDVDVAGERRRLQADSVVLCAGQQAAEQPRLPASWKGRVLSVGGARDCAGLDAERAIAEGVSAAWQLLQG